MRSIDSLSASQHPSSSLSLPINNPCSVLTCSYVSGGFYARAEGKNWIQTMLVTACLFPLSCFSIAFVLNTIAIFYQVGRV